MKQGRGARTTFGPSGTRKGQQDCREARTREPREDFLRDFQLRLTPSMAKDRRFAPDRCFRARVGIGATPVNVSAYR